MKFTEAKLEQAVIELFEAEGYKHLIGEQIHKGMSDVLLPGATLNYGLRKQTKRGSTRHREK